MRECLALVDEGVVDAEELDLNVKWGIGYKLAVVPPMQLLDMAGLDIYNAVASYLNQDLSNEKGVSSTITDRVDQGKLGIKTGGGLLRLRRRACGGAAEGARGGARGGPEGAELRWEPRSHCSTAARSSSTSRTSPGTSAAGNPVRFPVYSVLIEHDSTGCSCSTPATTWITSTRSCRSSCPSRRRSRRSRPSSTRPASSPRTSTGVINSHLHFDHVGGNKLLPNATTYLHEAELRQARSPEPFERLGYSDKGFDWEGARFELLDGDVELSRGSTSSTPPATRSATTR